MRIIKRRRPKRACSHCHGTGFMGKNLQGQLVLCGCTVIRTPTRKECGRAPVPKVGRV